MNSEQAIRQTEIWQGLYGPTRAASMIAAAVELLATAPTLAWSEVIARIDPEDPEDFEAFAGMRPGVG